MIDLKRVMTMAALILSSLPVWAAGVQVSAAHSVDPWPLTVEAGVLNCERSSVIFTVNQKTYLLNGTPDSRAKARGWSNVREIWRDNPAIPGTKVSIGPLISRGLLLCAAGAG